MRTFPQACPRFLPSGERVVSVRNAVEPRRLGAANLLALQPGQPRLPFCCSSRLLSCQPFRWSASKSSGFGASACIFTLLPFCFSQPFFLPSLPHVSPVRKTAPARSPSPPDSVRSCAERFRSRSPAPARPQAQQSERPTVKGKAFGFRLLAFGSWFLALGFWGNALLCGSHTFALTYRNYWML